MAAACAAAIGFALHLDHVGWACDAALMVMRPLPELLRMRGTDRVVAVLVGGRFLLLLVSSPNGAEARFFERKWETVLGVALAVFFGVVVPALLKRAGQASDIKRQWSSTADLGRQRDRRAPLRSGRCSRGRSDRRKPRRTGLQLDRKRRPYRGRRCGEHREHHRVSAQWSLLAVLVGVGVLPRSRQSALLRLPHGYFLSLGLRECYPASRVHVQADLPTASLARSARWQAAH